MQLSPGITIVDSPIRLRHGQHLSGHGKGNSILQPSADFEGDSLVLVDTDSAIDSHNRHCRISDITIDGVNRQRHGIRAIGSSMLSIDRVEVTKCDSGITLESVSIVTKIDDCKINDNVRGVIARDNANGIKLLNSRIQASQRENVVIDGPATFSVLISGCYIESSGLVEPSPGVFVGESGEVNCVTIIGCGFEKNRCGELGQIKIGNDGSPHVASGAIIGCSIIGDAMQGRSSVGINLQQTYSMTLMGNRIAAHRVAGVLLQQNARGCCWYGGHVDFVSGATPPSKRFVEHGMWQQKNQYV